MILLVGLGACQPEPHYQLSTIGSISYCDRYIATGLVTQAVSSEQVAIELSDLIEEKFIKRAPLRNRTETISQHKCLRELIKNLNDTVDQSGDGSSIHRASLNRLYISIQSALMATKKRMVGSLIGRTEINDLVNDRLTRDAFILAGSWQIKPFHLMSRMDEESFEESQFEALRALIPSTAMEPNYIALAESDLHRYAYYYNLLGDDQDKLAMLNEIVFGFLFRGSFYFSDKAIDYITGLKQAHLSIDGVSKPNIGIPWKKDNISDEMKAYRQQVVEYDLFLQRNWRFPEVIEILRKAIASYEHSQELLESFDQSLQEHKEKFRRAYNYKGVLIKEGDIGVEMITTGFIFEVFLSIADYQPLLNHAFLISYEEDEQGYPYYYFNEMNIGGLTYNPMQDIALDGTFIVRPKQVPQRGFTAAANLRALQFTKTVYDLTFSNAANRDSSQPLLSYCSKLIDDYYKTGFDPQISRPSPFDNRGDVSLFSQDAKNLLSAYGINPSQQIFLPDDLHYSRDTDILAWLPGNNDDFASPHFKVAQAIFQQMVKDHRQLILNHDFRHIDFVERRLLDLSFSQANFKGTDVDRFNQLSTGQSRYRQIKILTVLLNYLRFEEEIAEQYFLEFSDQINLDIFMARYRHEIYPLIADLFEIDGP